MKVCILGSGLTALTLAKALVNQNIFVDLVPSYKKFKNNSSRTIGITKSNCEYFNRDIISIDNFIWKLKKIEIFSDYLGNEKILNFENKDQLFSIIKNNEILEILSKSLSKNKFFKKLKLEEKYIELDKYNLLINTDYNSKFTKKYFNKKIKKTYNSSAYTTVINHEKILNDVAIQIFSKFGPLAFLPISSNKTSIVYSIYNSKINNCDKIIELINKYNPKYKIKKIERLETFDLKSFVLRSYYHKNILAFGDLLHKVHPLAGQGFNMTIRDIKTLIYIIKQKIDLGMPIDSSVNKEFEKKLRSKNYIFSTGIDLIHEFFNFERKLNSNVLTKSIKLLGRNNSINKMFNTIADKGINF